MKFLKDNITGKKACYKTSFEYEVNDATATFKFHAEHSTFNSAGEKYNDNIYEGDVCELFISSNDRKNYYEIEVAPNGVLFFGKIFYDTEPHLTKLTNDSVFAYSTINDDNSYDVEIKLTLGALKIFSKKDIIFNAYRIETDGEKSDKHLFALFPTKCGSFHKPEFFKHIK